MLKEDITLIHCTHVKVLLRYLRFIRVAIVTAVSINDWDVNKGGAAQFF